MTYRPITSGLDDLNAAWRSRRLVRCAPLASTILALVSPAHADAPQAHDANMLETVLVTAQKVSEDVRKVPESISVISADQIEARHLTEIADLTRSIPNLSFSTQGGPGNQNIELRGISSAAGSSTVSVYLDDVSMTVRNLDTQGQAEPAFFDVQRVEVLRGPQGTLYGKNATGGAVSFYSANPSLTTTDGYVTAGFGNYSDYSVRAAAGTPIALATDPIVAHIKGAVKGPDADNIAGLKTSRTEDKRKTGVLF